MHTFVESNIGAKYFFSAFGAKILRSAERPMLLSFKNSPKF